MIERVEIPDDLKVLCPENQKKVIVVGANGYMLYPLTEGQAEKMSSLISDIMTDIMTSDLKCPKCNEVYPGALGKKDFCSKCKSKVRLESAQKSPIEALTVEDRIPKMIEELIEIPANEVKEQLTVPQFKHIAGVLYGQNFKDDGVVPEESKKNFSEMMKWIGLTEEKPKQNSLSESGKSMNSLPASTDLQESTSRENGESKEMEQKD